MSRDRTAISRMGKGEEGDKGSVYPDQFGFLTIGRGHLVDARKGGTISQKIIEFIWACDIEEIEAELLSKYPWMSTLDPVRMDAMIMMRFQLGAKGFAGFPAFLKAAQEHAWISASSEVLQSLWHTQTPARVERMAKQFLTGIYQFKEGF